MTCASKRKKKLHNFFSVTFSNKKETTSTACYNIFGKIVPNLGCPGHQRDISDLCIRGEYFFVTGFGILQTNKLMLEAGACYAIWPHLTFDLRYAWPLTSLFHGFDLVIVPCRRGDTFYWGLERNSFSWRCCWWLVFAHDKHYEAAPCRYVSCLWLLGPESWPPISCFLSTACGVRLERNALWSQVESLFSWQEHITGRYLKTQSTYVSPEVHLNNSADCLSAQASSFFPTFCQPKKKITRGQS